MERCAYYLLCTNAADGFTIHPILGKVATCQRCADKHDLELIPLEPDDDTRDEVPYPEWMERSPATGEMP